ncbi:MAG: hypothetical protein KUG77_22940 [Nannocystaceae bacterium]|nr:hypothetical protein [Nannocystaceae bacterium]
MTDKNNNNGGKRRRLSLKDLQLEVKTEEKVVGGYLPGGGLPSAGLPQLPTLPTPGFPGGGLPGWAMGPRSDSGAGDASAWNEGDITLAEKA